MLIHWRYDSYILPLTLAFCVALGLAVYTARPSRRGVPGAGVFALLCLAVAEWIGAYAMELGNDNDAAILLWRRLAYPGAVWVSVLWLAYVLNHVGYGRWLTRERWIALSIIPLLTLALVATNDMHGLMWTVESVRLTKPPQVDLSYGPGYWLYLAVSYLEIGAGILLLIRELRDARHFYRRQTVAILLAALVPWVAHILYLTELTPIADLDLTPATFAFSGLVFAWALFSTRLFDLAPVARSTVVDEMKDGVIVLDAQERIVDLNPVAAWIVGRPAVQVVGQPVRGLLPPSIVWDALQQAGVGIETRLSIAGAVHHFEVRVGPLTYGGSRSQGQLLILHDITKSKRAEATFRALLESAPDAIVIVDRDDHIRIVNTQAEQLFGYTRDELIGQPLGLLLPESVPALHEAQHGGALGDPLARPAEAGRELQARRQDGSLFPADIRLSLLEREEGLLITAVIRDITERRRAEEERVRLGREQAARAEAEAAGKRLAFLSTASRMLSGSLDYSPTLSMATQQVVPYLGDWCALDMLDEDGVVQRVAATHRNPAKTLLVYQLQHAYTQPLGPDHGFPHVLRTGQTEFVPDVAAIDLTTLAVNEEHLALLRELECCSYMCVPLRARGRAIGAMTFAMGESGRQYGAADRILAEDLAGRVALAADNARLYQAAQEAIHARDEFLSIASHELRTPLTSLHLAVQSVQRGLRNASGLDPKSLAHRLSIVESQSKRLGGLINELLDISRISAGRLELAPEPVDLVVLTRQVIARLQDDLAVAGCPLSLQADTPAPGTWDPLRLDQVITNLLTNAMKYGRGQPIEVRVTPYDGSAQLAVQDHGIGIAPQHLERIFSRFERAVAPGKYGGMGLGLYIARQIVEAHGGQIAVTSAPAQGALFTVDLPRDMPVAVAAHHPAADSDQAM